MSARHASPYWAARLAYADRLEAGTVRSYARLQLAWVASRAVQAVR